MEQASTYLKTVPFTDFLLWDVKRYNYVFNSNFDNAVFLKDILIPYKKSLPKEELIKNDWRIISKINFQGELFLRDKEDVETYKGTLYKVPDNSIIYSKINVRHGCIYYHNKGEDPFGVSSEYPTFTFNENKVDGKYLMLVLRSNEFKRLLNTKASGISKARVKVHEFLGIKIPLPTIQEQNRIVAQYNQKVQLAKQQEQEASLLEEQLNSSMDVILGIEMVQNKTIFHGTYLKSVQYDTLNKWGIDLMSNKKINYSKNYEVLKIAQVCSVSSGGTPSRSRKDYYKGDIPWIKTGEVINDVIYNTEEKITQEAIDNSSAKLYPIGSLIIAMYGQGKTRGRTAKLGVDATTNQACAVLYDINNALVLTDYLWVYLQNEYDRLRELASGNSQPNLNAEMIKNYPVVIPPISEQQKIIDRVFKTQQQIKDLKNKADKNQEEALRSFEQEIFSA